MTFIHFRLRHYGSHNDELDISHCYIQRYYNIRILERKKNEDSSVKEPYAETLNIKTIDLLDTVKYFWNAWRTKYNRTVNWSMSKLQEVLLDNYKLAVHRYKADDFYSDYAIMAVMMLSLAPVTVTINGITIYVFWREKRMRAVTDILFCFLTITDVIGGILAKPLFAAESMLLAAEIGSPCSFF